MKSVPHDRPQGTGFRPAPDAVATPILILSLLLCRGENFLYGAIMRGRVP
nr:MAG TPA: hypothetical protein [Caudoviricetes sp.]